MAKRRRSMYGGGSRRRSRRGQAATRRLVDLDKIEVVTLVRKSQCLERAGSGPMPMNRGIDATVAKDLIVANARQAVRLRKRVAEWPGG